MVNRVPRVFAIRVDISNKRGGFMAPPAHVGSDQPSYVSPDQLRISINSIGSLWLAFGSRLARRWLVWARF